MSEARRFYAHVLETRVTNRSLGVLGFHARTWREAKADKEKATHRVCMPGTLKIRDTALNNARARARCRCTAAPWLQSWNTSTVLEVWQSRRVEDSCLSHTPAVVERWVGRSTGQLRDGGFIVATDHDAREIDAMFASLGATTYDAYNSSTGVTLVRYEGGEEKTTTTRNAEEEKTGHRAAFEKLRKHKEPLLIDLALMVMADRFVGTPCSSLTKAVCQWRHVEGRHLDEVCELLDVITFSDRCVDMVCS